MLKVMFPLTLGLLLLMAGTVTAQSGQRSYPLPPDAIPEFRRPNRIIGEMLGGSQFISLHYERLFLNKERHYFMGARIGVGSMFIAQTFNHSLHFCVGTGSHYADVGLGGVLGGGPNFSGERTYDVYNLVPQIGYRLQPRLAGFTMGISFMPLIPLTDDALEIIQETDQNVSFLPWAGVQLGYSF